MSEIEDDFFKKTKSEDLSSVTVTTRLKKLIGKSDENEKTRESSIVNQSEEIMWGSENVSTQNKTKFWKSITERESNQGIKNLVTRLEK